jgi:2-dehydropantoate 2-reductase
MRVVVMGAGALGSYYAGMLARAGHEVTCVARGEHLAAMRERGLTVEPAGMVAFTVPVVAVADLTGIAPADLILLGVKTYDNAATIPQLRPIVGPGTLLLSLQNGVSGADELAEAFGHEAVLGCVVYRAARLAAPGVVVEGGIPGSFVFGELGGGISPRAERLLATLTAAGLDATLAPAIRVTMWEKFVGYTGGAAVSTLTRLPPDRVWACAESRELTRLAMQEAAAVGRAAGVPLPEDTVARLGALYARMTPGTYPSLYYDLIAGKRLEVEALNGKIVRLGRELGVPTPIQFTIYAALKPYATGATTQAV